MITNIYKSSRRSNELCYVGTLRNAKKFNINDSVWFASDNKIIRGLIKGVELTIDENPEFLYKIQVPSGSISYVDGGTEYKNIKCDKIFSSIGEAKESAIKYANREFNREIEKIESYFSQFEFKYEYEKEIFD